MVKTGIVKDGERTLKITVSLDDDETTAAKASTSAGVVSPFVDEEALLQIANLGIVQGRRNTEHGQTPVDLLEFRDAAQRQKLVRMFAMSFPQVLQQLMPYVYLLGAHPRAAVRQRVAELVGELMGTVDFVRYKEKVLLPWALSDNLYMNAAVGSALAVAAETPDYVDSVRKLLKHWMTSSNHGLNWTAVASYVHLASLWPEDALEILEIVFKRESLDLLVLATFVIQRLCQEGYTGLILSQLARWSAPYEDNRALRRSAVLVFLQEIELSQVYGDGALIDHVVNIFLVALSDRKLLGSGVIRTAALDKLKVWTEQAFEAVEKQDAAEKLWMRLCMRAETPRDKERLLFHLGRWAQKDQRFAQFLPSSIVM